MAKELLIRIKNLHKYYEEKTLFENAEVNINLGQKIAIIGRNGAGKTTLLKMILNQEHADRNSLIEILPHTKIGYLEQKNPFKKEDKVEQYLAEKTGKEHWQIQTILRKFDFKDTDFERKIEEFSGGWQMRIKLAEILLKEPNCIFLDEPTNYLDLPTLVLLEEFLLDFKGTVLVISHDREFLKKTCDHTMEVENGKIRMYTGGLEEYLQIKEIEKEKAGVKNKNIEKKQRQLQNFVDKFGSKATKASTAKSKEKQISRLEKEKILIGKSMSNVIMNIPQIEQKKGSILEIENLKIGYEEKVVAKVDDLSVARGAKVAILGENGQGKSTFLKTIAGILKEREGKIEWKNSPKIAYYHQQTSHDFLKEETVFQYIKRKTNPELKDQEILQMLASFLFSKNDFLKDTAVLSGGEQSRLYLACMFLSKADVYLLDEPTNHLDIETVEVMAKAIKKFNGTVFFVSHDRTFVNVISESILEVNSGKIKLFNGDYEYYVWVLHSKAHKLNENEKILIKDNNLQNEKNNRKNEYLKQKKMKNLQIKIEKLEQQIKEKEEKLVFDKEYDELLKKLDEAETEFLTI